MLTVQGSSGAPLVCFCALALSACGGGDGAETKPEAKKQTEQTMNPRNCDVLGINIKERKTGTCEDEGATLTVVNRNDTLKLDELDAKLNGEPDVLKVAASDGYNERASGQYIVLGLSITNRTEEPKSVAEVETTLIAADGNHYSADTEATLAVPGSILRQGGKNLQPGLIQSGRIAFDVPSKVAQSVAQQEVGSNLLIEPFSQLLGQPNTTLGYIRLYQ